MLNEVLIQTALRTCHGSSVFIANDGRLVHREPDPTAVQTDQKILSEFEVVGLAENKVCIVDKGRFLSAEPGAADLYFKERRGPWETFEIDPLAHVNFDISKKSTSLFCERLLAGASAEERLEIGRDARSLLRTRVGDKRHFDYREMIRVAFLCKDELLFERAASECYALPLAIEIKESERRADLVVEWRVDNTGKHQFIFPSDPYDFGLMLDRWDSTLSILRQMPVEPIAPFSICINMSDAGAHSDQLSFCATEDSGLLPDPYFVDSRGYENVKTYFREQGMAWRERSDRLFWRGSTTGRGVSEIADLPRVRLCMIAGGRDDCDIKVSSFAQISRREENWIQQAGLKSDHVHWEKFSDYKYHIDIDGNANAWNGLFTKLLSGGLVFKVKSAQAYRQWYYHRLRPGFNCIEVASDMSDLLDLYDYYRKHEEEARTIAWRGQMLALSLGYYDQLLLAQETIAEHVNRYSSAIRKSEG